MRRRRLTREEDLLPIGGGGGIRVGAAGMRVVATLDGWRGLELDIAKLETHT